MILWPRRRKPELLEPRIRVNPRLLELQTAKEILVEIFHALPAEVEEMIQNRLEERSWREERSVWPDEEEPWPESFCLGK